MDSDRAVPLVAGVVALIGGATIAALWAVGDAAVTPAVVAVVFLAGGSLGVRSWVISREPARAPPQTIPPGEKAPPPETPGCPKCGRPTVFVAEHGRYYCPADRRYI